ncbi:MAG: TonB-dependent receptor [Acidobacteriia bacterium]|nr:TonB-dependent receptor [Terriglobia bacterium]
MAVALLLLWNAAGACAQSSKIGATLAGAVTDSSGAVVPEASVTLRNTSTSQTRTAAADAEGIFVFAALPVGSYELRVERPGFASYRQTGIELELGQTLHLDIALSPASSSESITVKAEASAIEPEQTSFVSSVDGERIEELPVRTRNSLDFVLLSPGVASSPGPSSGGGATPLAGSGFTFGGLRARSNNVSIDGLDNNDEYTGSGRTELSPEIVQEFQVVNNGLSAESGGASGGSINVITRSGANPLHGDTFVFAQDAAFDARDPFENEAGKPSFRRFRAGVALGGPVIKDRTFYYAAVEQEHNRGQGESGIDPQAASAINAFLSVGGFPGLATRQITTNFFPTSRSETEAAGRLDHHLTNSTSLMLRYAFTNNQESGDAFHANALTDVSSRGSSYVSDNVLSGSLTTVYGSSGVGDLRFEAATRRAVLRTSDAAGPEIDIAGLVDFGRPYAGFNHRRENHYEASYTYSRARGKHLWKAGGTVDRVGLRASAPDGFAGLYLFNTLSDFLAGRPGQFRQAFGNPTVDFSVTTLGGFVQDHWSLAPHVTLDAGIRYDFERLPGVFNQDTNNFSPRAGLAWNPSPKWVLRAGYGIFFDRYVLANLARAVEKNGLQGFEQVGDGAAAAALFVEAQGGPLLSPAPGIAPSIFRSDPRMATPYSQQISAGAEYLLAKNLSLRADYMNVRGIKLPRTRNVNLLPPVVLTPANAASLGIPDPTPQQIGREVFSPARVNPQFDAIYQIENSASSTYNGVSFTLNRKMNDELAFSASYTVSKAFDDASDFDEQPQNPLNLAAERAVSRQHQQQGFVFNALWELPIGDEEDEDEKKGEKLGWLENVFSHIEVAPIFTVGSGRPVDALTGLDSNQSHAYPISSRPLGFGRNPILIRGAATMDFRLLKYFPFGESRHLDVTADFFNLFNHANASQINPVFGSNLMPAAGYGQPIEGTGARQIQFSLDFEF